MNDPKPLALGSLFNLYGSDKDRNGYTPVYHALLKTSRNAIQNFCEVGIGTLIPNHPASMVGYSLPGYRPGGSLRAWRDWLPQADVVGVDVAPDCLVEEDRIRTTLFDSRDPAIRHLLTAQVDGRLFQVIVDDGLHDHTSQLLTLRNLFPLVAPGGFYIVEDVYPGSPFFEELSSVADVVGSTPWFTTQKKNLVVFSL